jgi:cell division protein FtsB
MKLVKYLVSLWVAVLVYASFSLLAGATGLSAYKQLAAEREKQRANLESLRALNRELEGTKDALLYDSDTIAVYAHELGYGAGEERFIRIVGLPGIKEKQIEAGRVVSAGKEEAVPVKTIGIAALGSALGVLACFFVVEFLKKQLNG